MAGLFKKDNSTTLMDDIDIASAWLEKRTAEIEQGSIVVIETNMPVLAKVICGGESSIATLDAENKKKYSKYFDQNRKQAEALTIVPVTNTGVKALGAGAVASGIGASVISSAALTGIGGTAGIAASGLGMAGLGAVAAVPALWPIGISMIAIGAGNIFKKKHKSKEKAPISSRLEKVFESCRKKAQKCNDKIVSNTEKMQSILTEKIKKAIDSMAETSRKIAINIDDAVNSDQNLRIMQYQEIVLKQYNNQNEIRKTLSELIEAYNKLKVENDELARKVAAYEANMKMAACLENYLA